MRESLKFIVSLVHNNMQNISKADLINHADDYHLYTPIVSMAQCAPIMAQMIGNANQIIPLNEITLSAEEFSTIVDEVYPNENVQQNEVNDIGIFDRYIQNLRESKPNDQVNEADVNATKKDVEQTYERIRDVAVAAKKVNNPDRVYGLVVGHVQSGKTRNYIGLALKAYEEGYNVVIVLTSNNTALAAQTKDRLMQEFGNAGCVPHNLDFLNNDFNVNIAVGHYYFGIAQKEIYHLEGIQNWLNAHQNQVESIRLFVIDDESDNATPNTNENQNADDLSDADVMRIADDILAGGNRVVSDWVRSLVKIDFDENDDVVTNARTLLTNNNGKSAIINLITNEEEVVCRLLGLDQDVDIEGQMLRLSEQVAGVFNNIARVSNPVRNWKTLRNLAWYCFNVRPNRSRINHTIVSLFSRADNTSEYGYKFDRLAYVGYTATPYANVLNENPEMDPLASDFMYPMHKSSHYFGMARIFGEPACQNDCNTNMNIVRKIDSEQELIDLIRELYDGQVDGEQIRVNENLEVIYQESPDLIACVQYNWASLKEAIAWLFCVAASRRLRRTQLKDIEQRKISNRWTTMLFNIGSEKGLHCYQKNIIQNYFNALANNDQVREEFVQLCQTRWENERSLFTRENFEVACLDYGSEIDDYRDWGVINKEIQWFLDRVANDNRVHAVEINCSPEGNAGLNKFKNTDNQYGNNNEDHIWIVCGGNKISRGLTLEGLVVTYFDRVRTSTCVDTLLQMGRWFGYREGYELLPRLWMNSDTIKEFKKMAKVERLMHKDLKDAFDAYPEYTPKDRGHYARIMQYGRNLSGRTAAAICSLASSGTGDVINAVSSAHRQDVLSVLNDFINQLGVNHQLNRPQTIYCSQDNANDTGFHSYPYWRNVSAEQIRGFLTRISQYAPTGEATSKINALNGEVVTCPWDVVISNQVPKGNPTYYEIANGLSVRLANNEITSVQGDVVKFGKFVGDRHAFFSGVKTKYIVQAEVTTIRKMLQDPTWSPLLDNVRREDCQTAIEQATEDCMLDAQIRRAAGLARMSGKNYRDVVFSQIPQAECTNPIFQISLVQPSDNNGLQVEGTLPFVVLSFYWPNRIDSERYWWASAGFNENDGETPQIDNHIIAACIDEIIDYHLFLHKDVLRVLLEERLGNVSNEKFNVALEMSRCCNINEGQGWSGLRTEIVYDGRWMQGWLKDVRNCYGIENIDECYAIRLQLESEAALILEYNDGRMHQTVLNNSLLDCGRRRDSIVRNNDFALLFENMEFRNELRQIHFGNDYIEQNEFNNY